MSMLHPVTLLSISDILAGVILCLVDVIADHTINWWNQPNALVLGTGAIAFVAYVIVITEILREVRYKGQLEGGRVCALDAESKVLSSAHKGGADGAYRHTFEGQG
jgi:hypothetical protein